MWTLKYTVKNLDTSYAILSKKYKITDYMYPVDHFIKNNKVYIQAIHIIEGTENKEFIQALTKDKKTKKFQINKNQVITLIAEEESVYKILFAAEIYHPAPAIIKNGTEEWYVAAWDRKILEKLIKELEKYSKKFQILINS